MTYNRPNRIRVVLEVKGGNVQLASANTDLDVYLCDYDTAAVTPGQPVADVIPLNGIGDSCVDAVINDFEHA